MSTVSVNTAAAPDVRRASGDAGAAAPTGKRASATGAEQARRQAWGREWGAVSAAAGKQARGES